MTLVMNPRKGSVVQRIRRKIRGLGTGVSGSYSKKTALGQRKRRNLALIVKGQRKRENETGRSHSYAGGEKRWLTKNPKK